MLKRKYAHICIVLLLVGLAVISLAAIFGYYNDVYGIVCFALGAALIIPALVIRFKFIKCPSCGQVGPLPQWSENGTKRCHQCGKSFIYDR